MTFAGSADAVPARATAPETARAQAGKTGGTRRTIRVRLALALPVILGPGLVVMLADTDAGSLITAAQSGARWGYRMIVPELVLIPVLYVVQEMTVRLGIVNGVGHGTLIRQRFGRGWAMLSASTLLLSAIGALISEFAAVVGVGELFGVSRWLTIPVATAFLVGVGMTGSYRRVERLAIMLGLAELAFIPAMLLSHPSGRALASGITSMPLGNSSYLYLLAANVGAVIMPWMIFYQQGAVIDKGLTRVGVRGERMGTAVGAVLTQVVMIAMVVALARATDGRRAGVPLATVGQIAAALQPLLGPAGAKILFGAGMLGAALVAALVSSLAGAWGLSEIFGWEHSLNQRPGRANSGFFATYTVAHVAGAILVLASTGLVGLTVGVEVMNALLLPIVLGFLLVLEATALPAGQRMRGLRRYLTWALCLIVIGFGLFMIPAALGR